MGQDASLCACCLGPRCQTPWVAQSEEPPALPETAGEARLIRASGTLQSEAGVRVGGRPAQQLIWEASLEVGGVPQARGQAGLSRGQRGAALDA